METIKNLVHKLLVAVVGVAAAGSVLVAVTAAPAHALVPTGHAWLTRAPGGQVSSYSTGNKPAILTHLSPGRWRAAFPGLPDNTTGIGMVSPGNSVFGATCTLERWYGYDANSNPHGNFPEIDVEFHCNSRTGRVVDDDFTVSFSSEYGPFEAWAVTPNANLSGPSSTYNWMGGQVDTTFTGGSFGQYGVTYNGFAMNGGIGLGTGIDPTGFNHHCTTLSTWHWPSPAFTTAPVTCWDEKGSHAGIAFAEHVFYNRGLFDDPKLLEGYATIPGALIPNGMSQVAAPGSFSSTGGTVHVNKLATGLYQVGFDGLAGSTRMVHVNTNRDAGIDVRCTAAASAVNTTGVVTVLCVHPDQTVADVNFSIAYSAKA